jgi:hypothetical protein
MALGFVMICQKYNMNITLEVLRYIGFSVIRSAHIEF